LHYYIHTYFLMLLKPSPKLADNKKKSTQSWIAILMLICFLSLGILLSPGLVFLAFPACSFIVGIYLYFKDPPFYVGFVFWMWFIGPLIRRLIDYRVGYLTLGPFTFTPFLVTVVTLFTFYKHLPQLFRKGNLPFFLCFGTVTYGLSLGLIQNPLVYVLNSLGWLSSLLFGFHLYVNWRYYPQYRQVIQRTFFWGLLLMGIYGVIQFCIAPEWDRFWIINIDKGSFGKPEPFGIRTSSTMESAHSFGYALTTGLFILFGDRQNIWRYPVMVIALLALLLTQARGVWLGLIIGGMILILSLKPNLQIRALIGLGILSLLVIPLITMEPFSGIILERFDTFTNINNDGSLNARLDGYNRWVSTALSEIIGRGSGFQIVDRSIGSFDGTLLPMLLIFGWIGIIPYFSGLFLLLANLFQTKAAGISDSFTIRCRSIVFGLFAQIAFSYLFVGAMGVFFWGFLGLGLASQKYNEKQIRLQSELT
ncbi:MAG: O-antigen ligase domain-containing protein, partial [Cyanobacteria bacterium P01_G01_bin.67]